MSIYLYIKKHKITGLKYFGKTTQDPYWYRGSGTRWNNHLKKHGNLVETTVIGSFSDSDALQSAALEFSLKHNIAESPEWANLIHENGRDGLTPGFKHSSTTRKKISASHIGVAKSKEHAKHISEGLCGKKLSNNHKQKLKEAWARWRQNGGRIVRHSPKLSEQHRKNIAEGVKAALLKKKTIA